jgi:hypothetical protein
MIFERGDFKSSRIQKSFINDSLNESRRFNAKTASSLKPTIFLSHKHNDLEDEEELKGFIELIEGMGAKVYIDSMDNTLPQQTTGDTAKRIKEIIKFCNKFILIATEKAIMSFWCNWELGVGDVYKYMDHIALLPIKEKGTNDSKYKGNEYLQIYPKIEYKEAFNNYNGHYFEEGYYVSQPENNERKIYIQLLKNWLKR